MPDPAQRANKLFIQTFGTKADGLYLAPGRINLMGENAHYNEGFVLSSAINFHTVIAVKRRTDQQFRAVSDAFPGHIQEWRFGKEDTMIPADPKAWVNYLKGFTASMAATGLPATGMDLSIVSNVPLGAGLSSSAALEIAFGTAINDINQLHLSPLAIAQVAQRGENQYAGYHCGIVDQMISAMGQQDHALLIDCFDLDSEAITIPKNLSLFIVNSNVERHELEPQYQLRALQCQQVASHFKLDALSHLTLKKLELAKDELDDIHYRRAKHIVTENRRTQQAAWALEAGNIKKLSQLMAKSHASMKDDFEITVPAINCLVDIIANVVGEQGGVRMASTGFGGCVVALVDHQYTDAVVNAIETQYFSLTQLEASIYLCSASDGAKRLAES
ncbi:galactokinase [Shewanella surugensis]|uniref:Galactokinase n=1 Tax=Shewanella surugensis TaxID=212020 RepID=A0ABT0LA13_9GAMM|nr:galactokinase [Shewanella surugensis]MCL1124549.1 galactokinase [Shewanella surugensis]